MHDVHLEVSDEELPDHDGEAAERGGDAGVGADEAHQRDALPHLHGGGIEGEEGDEEEQCTEHAVHATVALQCSGEGYERARQVRAAVRACGVLIGCQGSKLCFASKQVKST